MTFTTPGILSIIFLGSEVEKLERKKRSSQCTRAKQTYLKPQLHLGLREVDPVWIALDSKTLLTKTLSVKLTEALSYTTFKTESLNLYFLINVLIFRAPTATKIPNLLMCCFTKRIVSYKLPDFLQSPKCDGDEMAFTVDGQQSGRQLLRKTKRNQAFLLGTKLENLWV